ncbi:MAG: hypothetical protein ACOX9C_03380 [Kiritimatiellia bacterium]|jgi:hypothetical protein
MKRTLSLCLALLSVLAVLASTPAEKAAETAAIRYADLLESGQIAELYSALPASYQKDVATVVRTFGATVDADIWKEIQSVFGLLADVAIEKPGLVAELIADGSGLPTSKIAPNVAKTATSAKSLVGKISLDELKAGNVKKILSLPEVAAISKFTTSIDSEAITGAVIGSKTEADGSVVVTFKQKNGDPEDVEFVLVEGVWVPEDMAKDWKEGINETLNEIQGLKFDSAKKQQVLMAMPMIKSGLQSAKQATTKDQLQQSLMMSAFSAMMFLGGGSGTISPTGN